MDGEGIGKGEKLVLEMEGDGLLHGSTISCQSPGGIRKLCGMSSARSPSASPSTSSVNRVISAALVPVLQQHISLSLSPLLWLY